MLRILCHRDLVGCQGFQLIRRLHGRFWVVQPLQLTERPQGRLSSLHYCPVFLVLESSTEEIPRVESELYFVVRVKPGQLDLALPTVNGDLRPPLLVKLKKVCCVRCHQKIL
ncbi:unnamed protein product [Ectocarpus sp. CCAP 1310/34]|nr:unnamed protein product [Ectocarpus sp. CCAP 1310/34]